MNKLIPILALVAVGMTGAVFAEGVYRWEKDGRVYYSDQPPPNSNAKTVDTHVPGMPQTAAAVQADAEQDSRNAIRSQECDKARARLVEYQNSPVLKQRNLKGEERELSAEERIDIIVRAQTDVNQLCGEPEEPAATEETETPVEDFDTAEEPAETDF